jgi:SAM-dependent methyltransferase
VFENFYRRRRGRVPARLLSAATGGRVPAGPGSHELRAMSHALERRELQVRGLERDLETREAALAEREALLASRVAQLPPWDPAAHDVPTYPQEAGPVSRALLARIDAADLRLLEERLDEAPAAYWAQADEVGRGYLTLTFGTHYEIEPILAKTGLRSAMPPEGVHAMARGPLAAGGDPYIADFVMAALERAGHPLEGGTRALDFGCSSGRVVRVLAAARPDVEWLGCDPNDGAVAWAADHLDGIEFFRSPQAPPLDLADASLDLVYAISIWSHFDADAGLRWIDEMRRVLRPGGRLVFTTHGIASIGRQVAAGSMIATDALRCSEALYERGFWFAEVFGRDGDHGVVSSEWGMAYLTPEWLVSRVLPDWKLLLYEPGRLDANQDLYALERR